MNEHPKEEKSEETPSKEDPSCCAHPSHLKAVPKEEEEDFKDKYFRLLAEMENARKRLQKEKQEMSRYAIETILTEVLGPIDTFEQALGFTHQMSEETRNWARGFEMILMQFKEILSHHNIVPFHAKGEHFDPHKHEAVEVEETLTHSAGTIIEEFLKGYRSGDRILRPARVKVAKAPSTETINDEQKE